MSFYQQQQQQTSNMYNRYGNQNQSHNSNSHFGNNSDNNQQNQSNFNQWAAPAGNATPVQQSHAAAPHSGNRIQMNDHQQDLNQNNMHGYDNNNDMNSGSRVPMSNSNYSGMSNNYGQQGQPDASPQLWNPATINSMMKNDFVMNYAYDSGTKFLATGVARMVPGLELLMTSLRAYFAVDNSYVLRKIKRVLFPFLKKDWRRMEAQSDSNGQRHALPRFDENAPDLYIPLMSLVTYVLLCALLFGSKGKFTPEVLPDISSRCFGTQILEVLAVRFGHYVMQVPCNFIDLFCFTGYKYLGLCVNMLVGLFFGYWWFYGAMLFTASSTAFFMLKTMANNVPRITASAGPKREIMLLVFAGSQALTMWWLSQTKLLDD